MVDTDTETPESNQPSQPDPDTAMDQDQEVFVSYSRAAKKPPVSQSQKPAEKPVKDPKLQAFQDAVRHSERSTLIFNLNLGAKKTLNKRLSCHRPLWHCHLQLRL
jgi:hypothetical protein